MQQKNEFVLTDQEILQLFNTDKPSAILATRQHYRAILVRCANTILHNAHAAQQCADRALDALHSAILPDNPYVYEAYLESLVRASAVEIFRQSPMCAVNQALCPTELANLDDTAPLSYTDADVQALTRQIEDCITALGQLEAYVFIRRYALGETDEKIAARLSVKKGTVQSAISRVQSEIRSALLNTSLTNDLLQDAITQLCMSTYEKHAQFATRSRILQKRKKVRLWAILLSAISVLLVFSVLFVGVFSVLAFGGAGTIIELVDKIIPIAKPDIELHPGQTNQGQTNQGQDGIYNYEPMKLILVRKEDKLYVQGFYDQGVEHLTIPEQYLNMQICGILDDAFIGNTQLQSVYFEGDVDVIGARAFQECTSLYKVIFAQHTPRVIEEEAFRGDTSLIAFEAEKYSSSIEEFGDYAFADCVSLEQVYFSYLTKRIGRGAYMNCMALREAYIPDAMTDVPDKLFYGCINLHSVQFYKNLVTIGSSSFEQCMSLVYVSIPDTVRSIGANAFAYCGSLEEVLFTKNSALSDIGEGAFNGCTLLTSFTVPESVKKIKNHTFTDCGSLTEINLHDSLTEIQEKAFMFCNNLEAVSLPASLTTLGSFGFAYCNSLKDLYINNSQMEIHSDSFGACSALANIYYAGTIREFNEYILKNISIEIDCIVHCTDGSITLSPSSINNSK